MYPPFNYHKKEAQKYFLHQLGNLNDAFDSSHHLINVTPRRLFDQFANFRNLKNSDYFSVKSNISLTDLLDNMIPFINSHSRHSSVPY